MCRAAARCTDVLLGGGGRVTLSDVSFCCEVRNRGIKTSWCNIWYVENAVLHIRVVAVASGRNTAS